MATFQSGNASVYNQFEALAHHRRNGGTTQTFSFVDALSDEHIPINILTSSTARALYREKNQRVVNDGHSFRYLNPQYAPRTFTDGDGVNSTNTEGIGGTLGGVGRNLPSGGGGYAIIRAGEDEEIPTDASCYKCKVWCHNYEVNNGKPFNYHAIFVCVMMLGFSLYLTFTAKGVLAILQGIIGIIFGVEGLHNSLRNDLRGTRNFLVFLFFYALFGTAVSILTMNTIYFYCASAETLEESRSCHRWTRFYELWHLLGAVIIVPIMWAIFLIYYRAVCAFDAKQRRARKHRGNQDILSSLPQ